MGFSQSDVAGTDKTVEEVVKSKLLDAVIVQLLRLVIHDRDHVVLRVRDLLEDADRSIWMPNGLLLHLIEEMFGGKRTRLIEDRLCQVLLNGHVPLLPGIVHFRVDGLEWFPQQPEVVQHLIALHMVPSIGQQHPADVPKYCAYLAHLTDLRLLALGPFTSGSRGAQPSKCCT